MHYGHTSKTLKNVPIPVGSNERIPNVTCISTAFIEGVSIRCDPNPDLEIIKRKERNFERYNALLRTYKNLEFCKMVNLIFSGKIKSTPTMRSLLKEVVTYADHSRFREDEVNNTNIHTLVTILAGHRTAIQSWGVREQPILDSETLTCYVPPRGEPLWLRSYNRSRRDFVLLEFTKSEDDIELFGTILDLIIR